MADISSAKEESSNKSDEYHVFVQPDEASKARSNGTVKMCTEEEKNAKKRDNYLEWEEYFMFSALVASQRSKDPHTQVGVVIVNQFKRIVGSGYNGFPVGCSDDEFPWGKGNDDPLDNKHSYVVHAEANAILNKIGDNLDGCTLYTTTFPCNECAKLIIQSRISSIIFLNDRPESSFEAAKKMFQAVRITYRQFTMKRDFITLTLMLPKST